MLIEPYLKISLFTWIFCNNSEYLRLSQFYSANNWLLGQTTTFENLICNERAMYNVVTNIVLPGFWAFR